MLGGVPVGVCAVQFTPVCGNTVIGEQHVSCNITNIDRNTRIDETAAIDIPGGTPGSKCFYLELPNTELPPEVVIDTCTGIDPVLNRITGQLQYTRFDPTTGAAAPDGTGILLEQCRNMDCFCECSPDDGCSNRIAMTVWRRMFCFGQDNQLHPAGNFWIDFYPALEYVRTAQTSTTSSSADDGERFMFYAYTNPGYRGPSNIVPLAAGENGFEACYYGFTSNVCPPNADCQCGSCDGTSVVTPLAA